MSVDDPLELIRQQQRLIHELERRFDSLVKVVIPIGVTLLQSNDFGQLLEAILIEAKELCRADGGTIYLRTDADELSFAIVRNDSLGLALGGASNVPISFAPLPMVDAQGTPNHRNVATYAALTGHTVNIADAYSADGFEFSGTLAFDRQSGYRSTSFLTVPLQSGTGRVIGVLQLINAKDAETGETIAFPADVEPIVESLSTLAAAALEVYMREDRLRRQIQELRVQIDETKKQRQVAEIADTDYFQELQRRAQQLRRRS